MGNKVVTAPISPDSFSKEPVILKPGTIVTPIAENSDAVVYSTVFKGQIVEDSKEQRVVESVLAQNQGKYLVRPKNREPDGKVLQVKALSADSNKLYYIVRKQEGADKWIFQND